MAQAPQIQERSGTGTTTSLTFSTNEDSVVINGTVSSDTASVQVSVNGGSFVSDPSLILFNLQNITIPNPNSFPSGLQLQVGLNTILVRAIDIVGAVSAVSTVSITRVLISSDVITQIPTGIRVRRNRNSVDILAMKPNLVSTPQPAAVPGQVIQNTNTLSVPSTTSFVGFNVYASTAPGGSTGYSKVNASPVVTSTEFQQDTITSANDLAIWDNTTLKNVRIRVTEENDFGQVLAVRYDNSYNVANFAEKLQFQDTFQSYHLNEFVVFNHVRSGGTNIINSEQFTSVADTDPLYYVVTGVFFDSNLNKEVETPFSQEVLGTPLTIDTAIRDLPGRTAPTIQTAFIQAVQIVNADIAMIPGSTTRDVSINPFASEAERLWFLLDFVHRSQSFLTLLQFDDVNGTGTSDAVSASPLKTALKAALGIQTDDAVQSLIDAQFDKLAANVGQGRLPGRPSVGQITIFTTTAPVVDIQIPANTTVTAPADSSQNLPAVQFLIAGSATLPANNAAAFFNFDAKRYQITLDIVCTQIGTIGNRAAGDIKQISGVSGVLVTNDAATVFGDDQETNADLAARCILAPSSVDVGTEGGYKSTSAAQIGVIKSKIVKSGDPLMMRDYDPIRQKHIGGKVDIWIQGTNERTVTETFSFTFEVARNNQCTIIDLNNLIFRVINPLVTPSTPIIEILDNSLQQLGVRNATTGESYDLTGVTLLDYQTFQLNAALPDQPVTHIDDIITADFRFRAVNTFLFSFQPVRRVVSVVGEVSGTLDPTNNLIFDKSDDPLITGESTIAQDKLTIVQFNGVPSGATLTVNNETQVLIGFFSVPLGSIGINTATVRVFSADRTIEYNGPSAVSPDFDLILGTQTTPVKIIRTATSSIVSGQTVSIDYVHDENFVVTYVINDLLQQLQAVVTQKSHITGDILVKQCIENEVDIDTTVKLNTGAVQSTVDPNIRTAVSLILNQKTIGQGVAQSNIDSAINDTQGVDFNVLPFSKMAYADGSLKLRESVSSTFQILPSLAIGSNSVFILSDGLEFPTTDGGGLSTEHHGVFQDDQAMILASSMATVGQASGQGWIIGSGGAIIAGFSDDATLIAQGFTTSSQIEAQRLVLTANHVLISLPAGQTPTNVPTNHAYTVSYIVRGMTGSNDITPSSVEFIDEGTFTITYA